MIRKKENKLNKSIDKGITKGNTIGMKTAISIPKDLFDEVVKLASENKTSRSQLFSIAVKEYLERVESQKLLETLNKVYSKEEKDDEKFLRRKSLRYYSSAILKNSYENSAG